MQVHAKTNTVIDISLSHQSPLKHLVSPSFLCPRRLSPLCPRLSPLCPHRLSPIRLGRRCLLCQYLMSYPSLLL